MLFCMIVPNYLLHSFLKLEQIFTSVLFQQRISLRIVSDIDKLNIVCFLYACFIKKMAVPYRT